MNARDAIAGVGKVTITTANSAISSAGTPAGVDVKARDYVSLEVSDTGRGMDQPVLAHIFEPFFSTKEFGKGTGLGLATVYGIVKQNGGFVDVHSQLAGGTTTAGRRRPAKAYRRQSVVLPRPWSCTVSSELRTVDGALTPTKNLRRYSQSGRANSSGV